MRERCKMILGFAQYVRKMNIMIIQPKSALVERTLFSTK